MKIYLDNNLGVSNVEQEELTQDTIGYNILKVYIPNTVLTPYNTFTCYYGALLQNGRKVGWFAMEARTSSDADYKANYTLYKATLEQCVVSVEGKVYIGCQVLLGNSGNATLIKKNTAVVQFNVRKSVAINNDILVLDTDQTTTDVLESYKNLLENALTTYATKATTYTKAQVDALLLQKADKSDTYTKQEVNTLLAHKVAHDGNQLKDNNGNNIYPNLDAKTQAKIDNAYGPAYVGKDTSAHILAFTSDKGIWVGTDTGHWYYWNGTQYADGGVYQTLQGVEGKISKSSENPLENKAIANALDTEIVYKKDFVNGNYEQTELTTGDTHVVRTGDLPASLGRYLLIRKDASTNQQYYVVRKKDGNYYGVTSWTSFTGTFIFDRTAIDEDAIVLMIKNYDNTDLTPSDCKISYSCCDKLPKMSGVLKNASLRIRKLTQYLFTNKNFDSNALGGQGGIVGGLCIIDENYSNRLISRIIDVKGDYFRIRINDDSTKKLKLFVYDGYYWKTNVDYFDLNNYDREFFNIKKICLLIAKQDDGTLTPSDIDDMNIEIIDNENLIDISNDIIEDGIQTYHTISNDEMVLGNYENDGPTDGGTNRVRTDVFILKPNDKFFVQLNSFKGMLIAFTLDQETNKITGIAPKGTLWDYNYKYAYTSANFERTWLPNTSWNFSQYYVENTSNKKIGVMMLFAKRDDSDLQPSDVDVVVEYESEKISLKSIKKDLEEKINDLENKDVFKDSINFIGIPSVYKSPAITNELLDSKTLNELYGIYDDLVTNYPNFITRGSDIGTDASGLTMRQYIIKFNPMYEIVGEQTLNAQKLPSLTNTWDDIDGNQKVILINTGCHGNEKSACWGVAQSIKQLVESTDDWAMYIKSNFMIKICACMNPYGFENNHRTNYNNTDLNRDCSSFTQPETQAWKTWVDANREKTVLYLDCHGTTGYYPYFEAVAIDKNYLLYTKVANKVNAMLYGEWKTFYNDTSLSPYFFMDKSTYKGMTMSYTSDIGLKGFIIETPQNIDSPNNNWNNYSKGIKLEVDMLINTIIVMAK